MYFYDVRESYFDVFREVMNPFYKDPNGKICTYTEMKRSSFTTNRSIRTKINVT